MKTETKSAGFNCLKQMIGAIPLSIAVLISLGSNAVWAEDPFRTENPRDIGEHTEQAFKTIFLEGDYKAVREELMQAEADEADEPLVHAMLASLAYTEKDWATIKIYADQTLATAESLSEEDPLRGNLYLAVVAFFRWCLRLQRKRCFRSD